MTTFWTTKKIKKGFEEFKCAHGRLPKASEIDTLDYLPSSRYIQKRFGGVELLRNELGYTNTHFGKGAHRSIIAIEAGVRSKEITSELLQELQNLFGRDAIYKEKTFSGKHRVDFYIHTDQCNFGIDIFYAETIRTLQSSVNIKMKKYTDFTEPLYLTIANKNITQCKLDNYVANKRIPLPSNIYLVTLPTLRKNLKNT